MSLKGSHTTTGYIEWDKLERLSKYLYRKRNYKFYLLIRTGMNTGLRIGDILNLKWKDVLGKEYIDLTERKTKKFKRVSINEGLRKDFDNVYRIFKSSNLKSVRIINDDEFVFTNKFKSNPISVQYVNTRLKKIVLRDKSINYPVSSHSLRKSFGRRVWEMNNYSDRSLILLS